METDLPIRHPGDAGSGGDIVPPAEPASLESTWREYLFFREEMRHEDGLINQRLSWLISSQAFLLGGFATLISTNSNPGATALASVREVMLKGLPVAGVLGVAASYVTILAAVLHMRGVRRFAANLRLERMPSLQHWHTTQFRMGLFGPLVTPLIFLAFWIAILANMR